MRFALAARLSRPISLYSFSRAMELSRGSLVLSLHHLQWTASSIICVLALSTMTAGQVILTTMPLFRRVVEIVCSQVGGTFNAYKHQRQNDHLR